MSPILSDKEKAILWEAEALKWRDRCLEIKAEYDELRRVSEKGKTEMKISGQLVIHKTILHGPFKCGYKLLPAQRKWPTKRRVTIEEVPR